LATLKTIGHGRDTKSRWRNWRNNTTIRSALTEVLKYKCKLAGVILRFEQPVNTSHTCPRCGKHADTFKSPTAYSVD
ncbi:MAG: zinc ribbon domain-containing protein, partial [Methylobacter sp.]|nr:zinc ribbon domain-containing protein [Methylobacter sp.]